MVDDLAAGERAEQPGEFRRRPDRKLRGVIRPASQTPFSALAIAVLAERAGMPPGVEKNILEAFSQHDGRLSRSHEGVGLGDRPTLHEYPVSDLQSNFFFAQSGTIYGGTADIQRNIIAERVLGLPR